MTLASLEPSSDQTDAVVPKLDYSNAPTGSPASGQPGPGQPVVDAANMRKGPHEEESPEADQPFQNRVPAQLVAAVVQHPRQQHGAEEQATHEGGDDDTHRHLA